MENFAKIKELNKASSEDPIVSITSSEKDALEVSDNRLASRPQSVSVHAEEYQVNTFED